MGLLDVISGRTGYFNNIVVPVHNEIGGRIKLLNDNEMAIVLAGCLDLVASKVIDYLFKTNQGGLSRVVKNYTITDIKKLYAILMTWFVIDLINLGSKRELRTALGQVLDYSEQELNNAWQPLEHKTTSDLYKLWEEITKILQIDTKSEEGYLAFKISYSRIAKEGYHQLN